MQEISLIKAQKEVLNAIDRLDDIDLIDKNELMKNLYRFLSIEHYSTSIYVLMKYENEEKRYNYENKVKKV